MNYILASVFSNLSYAFADNANGLLSRRNKALQIAIWATTFGILIFFIPMLVFFRGEFSNLSAGNIAIMLSINILVNIGYLSFITGMTKGSITLTGVIGGSFPAVTTIVALLFFKETVNLAQALAILLVLTGVVLSSMHGSIKEIFKDIHKSGAIYAFGAFFFWGIYFALVRIPIESVGWFLPQYTASIIGLVMFLLIAKFAKDKESLKRPQLPWLIAITATLQIAGSIFFNYAISKGNTSIVAPIAGSSPAVFVLLAFFIFKEQLNKKQWLGIALALTGIIGLSLAS